MLKIGGWAGAAGLPTQRGACDRQCDNGLGGIKRYPNGC
jgi:hypothetical protein